MKSNSKHTLHDNISNRLQRTQLWETKSLTNFYGLPISISTSNDIRKSAQLVDELRDWSETVECTTILILDNCDDILADSFRKEFIGLIELLVKKSLHNLHIIVVSIGRNCFIANGLVL